MWNKLVIITILLNLCYTQDILYTYDGREVKGKFDRNSVNSSSLRFKEEGENKWKFYHTDLVNFVKSFNGTLLYPIGLVGNSKSHKYHLPNVKHLPSQGNKVTFKGFEEADSAGYKPCLACFDNRPTLSDYYLEREIAHSTVIAFKNANEILYEYEKLPLVRNLVNKILASWPETLKGYDYRIQVFRDDMPNAMAIGGGNLYLSSGLLDIAESMNELEAAIAHEIAHVERRHTLRQYYEYNKKLANAALATTMVGIAVIAAGGDANDATTAMTMTAIISDFAAELAMNGYSREMEQEADILAQLYLEATKKDLSSGGDSLLYKKSMIAILDKLAQFTISRKGFIKGANAFSDHPGLIQRIKQVERSTTFKYDEPLTFLTNAPGRKDLIEGFITLIIDHVYMAPSSNNSNEDVFFLIGTIINNHASLSFKIDDIRLNFLGSIGITPLEGVSGITVKFKGKTDFTGIIKSRRGQSDKVFNSLKNKQILPYSVGLSAVVLQQGGNAKNVIGYNAIKCGMTIN